MSSPLADRLRPKKSKIWSAKSTFGRGYAASQYLEFGYASESDILRAVGHRQNDACQNYSKTTNRKLHKLNGTNASTADIKEIVSELDTLAAPNGILLYLDEIQYFNKNSSNRFCST